MKKCVAPEYGGCGKEKSLNAYSISKYTIDGTPEYRPRCKACMCNWRKLSAAQRDAMRIPLENLRPRKIQKGEKQCLPVERGGCGKILPLAEFYKHNNYHKPRCRKCNSAWKHMTLEERRPFIPEKKFEASVKCHDTMKAKIPQPVEYDNSMNYFYFMPATDCEREYWRVGRACASGV